MTNKVLKNLRNRNECQRRRNIEAERVKEIQNGKIGIKKGQETMNMGKWEERKDRKQ